MLGLCLGSVAAATAKKGTQTVTLALAPVHRPASRRELQLTLRHSTRFPDLLLGDLK